MWSPFVDSIEKLLVANVARRGWIETPRPLRAGHEEVEEELQFVLDGEVGEIRLPEGGAMCPLPFAFPSACPVGDGSGDRASGLVVRPAGEPKRALLLVPGWLARFRPFFGWFARRLARDGALVVLLDLPAHFGRTAPGARHGARFFTGDPALTSLYLRAVLSDSRALLRALAREDPGKPLLACGFSLGAWAAGSAASLERSAGALLCTPAADPARLLRDSPLLAEVRREIVRAGGNPEEVARRAERLALRFRPAPAAGARLLVGTHDLVIPRDSVDELAVSWQAGIETFPVGHMTPYVSPRFHRRFREIVKGWEGRGA